MTSKLKYVLITGASSGIGRSLAVSLSKTHSLIVSGRDPSRLEETRALCTNPDNHLTWGFDLSCVPEIDEQLTTFLEHFNAHVAGYVHCAAKLHLLPLRRVSVIDNLNVFNVNLLSAYEIVRLLTKKSINSDALRNIVFISTTASQFGARGFTSYCASKAGLDGLMRALAVELAPMVRVNSILPGAVKTPMTREMFDVPELRSRLLKDYPLGEGDATDIANAVEFLLSSKSRWITGQQLVVDGGRTINLTA